MKTNFALHPTDDTSSLRTAKNLTYQMFTSPLMNSCFRCTYKARCTYIQYMANKPDKFGLKFWMMVDVDSK